MYLSDAGIAINHGSFIFKAKVCLTRPGIRTCLSASHSAWLLWSAAI